MVSEKRSKLKFCRVRLAPRRPSVLLGRKGKVAKSPTQMIHQNQVAQSAVLEAAQNSDLERYRRGEITEAEYLQARIEAATSHLKGRVSSERLQMLKEVIATRLDTDPLLLEARARLRSDRGATGSGSK